MLRLQSSICARYLLCFKKSRRRRASHGSPAQYAIKRILSSYLGTDELHTLKGVVGNQPMLDDHFSRLLHIVVATFIVLLERSSCFFLHTTGGMGGGDRRGRVSLYYLSPIINGWWRFACVTLLHFHVYSGQTQIYVEFFQG